MERFNLALFARTRYRMLDTRKSGQAGFSLFEIIFALLILAVAIAPIVSAYAPAVLSTAHKKETMVFTNQAKWTLNRMLALDFDTLNNNQGNPVDLESLFGSAEEAAKETFSLNGKSYTLTVAITDASSGAGGLLELTVTLDHISLKTLKAEY